MIKYKIINNLNNEYSIDKSQYKLYDIFKLVHYENKYFNYPY